MYGAVFYMAGAYTLSRGGHVRADMFYRKWPRRAPRRASNWCCTCCSSFPASSRWSIAGWGYGIESMRIREVSVNSPAGVPIWPLKMMIPVGAALIALQGFAEVLRCVLCLRDGQWPARLHDVEELEKQILERARARKAEQAAAQEAHDERSRRRPGDAGDPGLRDHDRLSGRLHADGAGRGLRLLRLLPGRTRRSSTTACSTC